MKTLPPSRNALKALALLCFAVPSLLLADEEQPHILVSSREKPKIEAQASKKSFASKSAGLFDSVPTVYSSSCLHWLYKVQPDTIELEDGSIWEIGLRDQMKVSSWLANDVILITQNNRFFPRYKYKLINKDTGISVEANLSMGPIVNGKFTRYIVGVDQRRGEIVLSDNTHWEITEGDAETLREWVLNDAILIGVNGGWASRYDGILVNVNMNNFVRVRQY